MGKAIFFSKLIILILSHPHICIQKSRRQNVFTPGLYLRFCIIRRIDSYIDFSTGFYRVFYYKKCKGKHNPIVIFIEKIVTWLFDFVFNHQKASLIVACIIMTGSFASAKFLGS